jgi:hypothetical protein
MNIFVNDHRVCVCTCVRACKCVCLWVCVSTTYMLCTPNQSSLFNPSVYCTWYKYQYIEINAIHFLFSVLRIKGLYIFRALPAHPQVALYKLHLVYCMRCHSQLALYECITPSAVCAAPPPVDEQVMLETCRGPWFSINWMKSASRWFHYNDILWCTVIKTLSLTNKYTYCSLMTLPRTS